MADAKTSSIEEQLEEAKKLLQKIAKIAEEYVSESEGHLHDSDFDSSFTLANSHAQLKLLIADAKKL